MSNLIYRNKLQLVMSEIWLDAVKVVSGAGTTLLGIYLKHKLSASNTMQRSIITKSEVYDALRAIVNNTPYHGAFIMKAHNGGATPKAGSRLFFTVIDQDFNSASIFRDVDFRKKYDKVAADAELVNLLKQVQLESIVDNLVEEMQAGSLLKGMFMIDGIEHFRAMHIGDTDKEMFVLVLVGDNAKDLKEVDTPIKTTINLALQRIRQTFEKSYKLK